MPVTRITSLGGRILSVSRDGVISNLVPDPQGNTVALRDSTGAITDTFSYWPYGAVRTHNGVSATAFQFQGALGLHTDPGRVIYVRARSYQPESARWLQRDPLNQALQPGNTYEYCFSNPVTWTDGDGRSPKPPARRKAPPPRLMPPWKSRERDRAVIAVSRPGGRGGGGHLYICVPNSDSRGSTWWGFYPERPGKGKGKPTGTGWVQRGDEPRFDGTPGWTWSYGYADREAIDQINWNVRQPPGEYSVITNNCADWGQKCLLPILKDRLGDSPITRPDEVVKNLGDLPAREQ